VDVIGKKVSDYEWAIRKHGLKTVTGAISTLGNPQYFGKVAAAAGIAGTFAGPVWAAIAGGLMLTSEIAVTVANRMIDLRDIKLGKDSEIALLYEANKLAKS
jgi:hypothetical protein